MCHIFLRDEASAKQLPHQGEYKNAARWTLASYNSQPSTPFDDVVNLGRCATMRQIRYVVAMSLDGYIPARTGKQTGLRMTPKSISVLYGHSSTLE